MKNHIYLIAIAFSQLFMLGCGNSDGNLMKLIEERDSLKSVSETQFTQLSNYGQMIEVINATLDSIAYQEKMIFVNNGEMPVTKEDVEFNLTRFEAILRNQKDKIDRLEEQFNALRDSNAHSLNLINHLRTQIAAKDRYIAQLKNELEKKNVNIAQLQEQVESQRLTIDTQKATISELNTRTRKQGEALARQDAILNNGYVLIGTKDDLKRKGVITKKGQLVSDAILDREKFAKVDIRTWQEISFTAKKPLILTNMPASSYELTTSGNRNFTLTIMNPSDFWRISNYLVIQTD